MIEVSDLIGTPFKMFGRTKEGLDCYGLVIEVEKRFGKIIPDFMFDCKEFQRVENSIPHINVKKSDYIAEGMILQFRTFDGRLHVGVALDKKTFIHATETQGVRISSIASSKSYMKLLSQYEVTESGSD